MRQTVTSADGTKLSVLVEGAGPAIVLVDGALCWTESGITPGLIPVLSKHFTVYAYDRRGRGQSGNTQPYAMQREYEDLAEVVKAAQAAGNSKPYVCGFSSGAALAFYAVSEGFVTPKSLIMYEAPFTRVDTTDRKTPDNAVAELDAMIAGGRRKQAVDYFMRDLIGIPGVMLSVMNIFMRSNMVRSRSVAHTLPYDIRIMDQTHFGIPAEAASKIGVPTLVIHGEKTAPALAKSAKAQAQAIPTARLVVAPKSSHTVKPAILTNLLVDTLKPGVKDQSERTEFKPVAF